MVDAGFPYGGFGTFEVLFFSVFGLIVLVIIISIGKSVAQGVSNHNSPRLTVPASVAAKRTAVRGGGETMARTVYYATFEVESGDRMELSLSGKEYGLLAEGDKGHLTFQGTRFVSYEREQEHRQE